MSKRAKISKKAKQIMKSDMFASVAMVSLLFNLFFIVGLVFYINSNRLDEKVYTSAYNNLCVENYKKNLSNRLEKSSNTKETKAIFDAYCRTGDFTDYFEEAVNSYLTDKGY